MRVGVVGATGQVGGVMRQLLADRRFPVDEIRFFASARSAGTTLPWADGEITVEDASLADASGLDIALFSAGAASSRQLAPKFAAAGATVIDNSSAFRMDPDVPLVVSEVNPEAIADAPKRIIANPNCTTMAGMAPLKALHDEAGLVRIVVSTYQAVSGAGGAGVDELDKQTREVVDRAAELTFDGRAVDVPCAREVRRADRLQRAGPGRQDRRRRLVRDRRGAEAARREPQDPGHPGAAGVRDVRAGPRLHGALAVDQRRVHPPAVGRAGHRAAGRGAGRRAERGPDAAAGGRARPSFVGRLRGDPGVPDGRGLALFVCGDNLRKGAALNAIQIAELLVR